MKESHPVEMAKFVMERGISDEPAFFWWVPYALKKRDAIISAINTRVRKVTHKYGIEVPTEVEHAKELDMQNGNTMWMDAMAKEMYNVVVAFEVLDEREQALNGWKKTTGHLVWAVKMEFTTKARWVLDGHKMPDPVGSTFAGVVSRESIQIARLPSMDWIFSQQTLGMPTYSLPHLRMITLSVVLSLGLKMWDVWH